MNKRILFHLLIVSILVASLAAACGPSATPTPEKIFVTQEVEVVVTKEVPVVETVIETVVVEPPQEEVPKLLVFGAFATPIEEPWDGVIHSALLKAEEAGAIDYEYTDNIGYAGDMERVLGEVAEQKKPNVIFGDAFGNEEAVRRVAAMYPDIAFVFGSGLGPSEPNLSVFDNWIHEPAYLSGMLAGGLT